MGSVITASLSLAFVASLAVANPVSGVYVDTNHCDNQGTQQAYEELGTFVFPPDELIDSISTVTSLSACVAHDDPNMANYLVRITNLTTRNWHNLFYVGDIDTTLSNEDGVAWSAAAPGATGQAFRIDAVGFNRNLVSESMLADGIFQVGETWEFIIQDFSSAWGGAAHDFSSLDFAGASTPVPGSTGSIVAMIPSPGSLALLGAGGLLGIRRRR